MKLAILKNTAKCVFVLTLFSIFTLLQPKYTMQLFNVLRNIVTEAEAIRVEPAIAASRDAVNCH